MKTAKKTVEFTTEVQNRGPFNPRFFNKKEYALALESVAKDNRTDPFAVIRAKNLMDRGVFRPSDILAKVSV